METVLLAADRPRDPGPLSTVASTPLLPAGDRPLAAHAADAAVAAGTDELVFAVGDNAPRVQSYFGGRYDGVPVSYVTCGDRARPGGALRTVSERFAGRVAVLDACWFLDAADVATLFENDATAVVHGDTGRGRRSRPTGRGDGGTTELAARPVGSFDPAACALPAAALADVDDGAASLRDVLAAVGTDALDVLAASSGVEVRRPADLVAANALALSATRADSWNDRPGSVDALPDSVTASGSVRVAGSATVGAAVTLEGPVLVAGGASVERDAVVREPVVVGPDTTVGAGASVESAVLFEAVTVEDGTGVRGGVLGPGCVVGADSSIAGVSGFGRNDVAVFATDGGRGGLRYW